MLSWSGWRHFEGRLTLQFRKIQVFPRYLASALRQAERAVKRLHGSGTLGREERAMPDIRRREFILTLGGAAVAWPFAARAQQPTLPVIGLLDSRSPEALTDRLRGFRQGLKDTGYVEGENGEIGRATGR